MNRVLFLVGFMGSGKSSLGKKLAKHFAMNFIDLDQFIEEKEGKSVNAIFAEKGEDYFRELEQQYLRNTDFSNSIIATGGGTPCFNNNMDYLKTIGAVGYLLAPLPILIGRLRADKANRPLLKDLDGEHLDNAITALYNKRKDIYEQADFIILSGKPLSGIKRDLSFLLS